MRKSSNINKLWSQLLLATLVLLMGTSALTSLTYAYIPGYYVHNACFQNDPYPAESATIKLRYHCDHDEPMHINLINPNGVTVQTWFIDIHGGYLYYSAPYGAGTWSLTCIVLGEIAWDDSAYQLFNIPDSDPDQIDLATDANRHPDDPNIFDMALSVINYPNSSLEAVDAICHHVNASSFAGTPQFGWRSDLDNLNEYRTRGGYTDWCQVAAVMVTSYARAIGIPARIIDLTATTYAEDWHPGQPYQSSFTHYFGECRIFNGTSYEWIPVDGDRNSGNCGWSEFNEYLSWLVPTDDPRNVFSVSIIKNFTDSGSAVYMNYPTPIPYSNA